MLSSVLRDEPREQRMGLTGALDEEELIALIALCALRDKSALKALYERTGAYMNAIAFRIVRSQDASNDVIQEAYLQIWHNAATYRPDQARALTWMSSIVRYRAIDRRERDWRLQRHTISWDADTDQRTENEQQSPEHAAINAQLQTQLLRCLSQLTERAQTCIRLAYLDGYSREEIAQHMQTNVNTVKSWLHRGADALKQCLHSIQASSP